MKTRFTYKGQIDVDSRHMIAVWEEESNGVLHYIPHFSRTGRSWSHYKQGDSFVSYDSYSSNGHINARIRAVKHCKGN